MNFKNVAPTAQHLAIRKALEQSVGNEGKDVPVEEILAVFCEFVGQLIALQDQRKFTATQVMELVSANIQAGNQRVLEELTSFKGTPQ